MADSNRVGEVVVVTGGAGFLGQHIVKHLIEQTEFPVREIRVFDIRPLTKWHPGLEGIDNDVAIKQYVGDLCNLEDVQIAFKGASVVIHNASLVDVTSLPDRNKLYQVNVIGTQNVIQACTDNNINTLIYTSSASAEIKLGFYGEYKNQAERLILQANNRLLSNGLRMSTCALRLPGMYGEGSTDVLEGIQRNVISNTFNRFGDEVSKFQAAYAGNMAWAFVVTIRQLRQATHSLARESPAGRAIGVTDDTSLSTYCGHLGPILKRLNIKISSFIIPFWFLYIWATLCELISFILKPVYTLKLPLSRVAIDHMHRLPVFDGNDVKIYLDYSPLYTFEESVTRTMVYLEHELDF